MIKRLVHYLDFNVMEKLSLKWIKNCYAFKLKIKKDLLKFSETVQPTKFLMISRELEVNSLYA